MGCITIEFFLGQLLKTRFVNMCVIIVIIIIK
jgi:hypothetical protein